VKQRVLGVMAIVTVMVGGCGGDDESSAGNLEEYCRLSAEAAESSTLPSAGRTEDFVDAAPSEIRDDVRVIVDALNSVDNPDDVAAVIAAFEEPEVVESIGRVEAFDAENCE
jgi:hypothetical protein